ncbi:choline ABC transporter ATP-binding protein [Brucella pseudogrignonensis]|uniref:Glycine betaine/proline transport system ATP-binding protein n=1 Tax=Brucella pseudogrignonensis TaxID=419475 RepID=A0ABU1M332_9HYPH|nr:choline ABC transporter ATP-binding protein [Brucella pseudogrignonensis]MDR6430436.1 glycine betaine/proline transport system ATP-binding protein [Brucella pseudogrignonensis]
MTIISVEDVSIIFGKNADSALELADRGASRSEIQAETDLVLGVHDCSLNIQEGEILVLMGLSGSGKSTLLRAINRLNPISRGRVLIRDGERTIDVGNADRKTLRHLRTELVSMVFQQFGLLPWRTVEENVAFGLEISGMSKQERLNHARDQLELVGLQDWAKRKVGELSGGMQQRVGLARAFATGAPILLMDEPFSALDPLIRTRLQDELLAFQSRLKKTIVFVSHDLDEAMKIGNRIAIMEGGRIVQCGTPQDILLNPADRYVADFVAHMNPLGVLQAGDIMTPFDRNAAPRPFAATTRKETLVRELMKSVADSSGDVGIVENGAIIGKINADDIVRALSWHQQRGQH